MPAHHSPVTAAWLARTTAAVRPVAHAVADLLLPRECVACHRPSGEAGGVVCPTCWSRLAMLGEPQCARCGHPTGGHACRFCELLPAYVRNVRSACWVPHETGSAVIHALKYDGWTAVAGGIAARLARLAWQPDVEQERAALVPVPLARVRERARGFNQAALIAEALAPCWRIPVWSDAIVRERATETQTRLTPTDRSANVLGAFSVPASARERVRGLHLVLVDDVITTGATLNACAAALFAAGARTISYVTFGRARTSGDR